MNENRIISRIWNTEMIKQYFYISVIMNEPQLLSVYSQYIHILLPPRIQNKTDQELLEPKVLYCVRGCNDGLFRYFKWIRG